MVVEGLCMSEADGTETRVKLGGAHRGVNGLRFAASEHNTTKPQKGKAPKSPREQSRRQKTNAGMGTGHGRDLGLDIRA